jgi:Zn-dependent membrane protease YugP
MEARTYIVPIVQLASRVASWLFVAGLMLQLPMLTWVGIILFGLFLPLCLDHFACRVQCQRTGQRNYW